jgi:deazaflavin-dependent oxidoreductase (nitroreductase family)
VAIAKEVLKRYTISRGPGTPGSERCAQQGVSMQAPRFMRRVNRAFTNPLMGTFAWLTPPLAMLRHVGRKSGREYRTPVLAFHGGTGFVIPMPYGRDVGWAQNLLAADRCALVQGGRRWQLHNPRIVDFDGAESALPGILRPALRVADLPGYVLLDHAGEPKRRGRSRRK